VLDEYRDVLILGEKIMYHTWPFQGKRYLLAKYQLEQELIKTVQEASPALTTASRLIEIKYTRLPVTFRELLREKWWYIPTTYGRLQELIDVRYASLQDAAETE
jgi:hypothetical protein